MTPDILYEDNHIIAVKKTAGLLTQGDATGASNLLDEVKSFIKERDNKPGNVFLGMVQRLDKPVSGVILFAKTSKAASRISEQIRKKKVEKLYLVVTELPTKKIELDQWVKHDDYLLRVKDRTEIGRSTDQKAQEAILERKTLYTNKQFGVHLIRLITGRKHQIRAQLSNVGLPILGDKKYGSKVKNLPNVCITLHAIKCTFIHPTKKETVPVVADLPSYFLSCFQFDEISSIEKKLQVELKQSH